VVLEEYTPERAALMTGVEAEDIIRAAEIYANGYRASGESIFTSDRGHSSILYAMGITQRSNGTDMVMTLANLAMLCGQVGKRSTGVNPLRGQSNVQGACDVGCLINVFPGYQQVTNESQRAALAEAWGVERLPSEIGLSIVEATQSVGEEGGIRAIYLMGENPMMSDPNINHVEQALRKLDLLIAQDIFLSETAQLAHLVLPAAASLEKDGTFTNTERRVQMIYPVLGAPGESLPDWQITGRLAEAFDAKMNVDRDREQWAFPSTAAIMQELAATTPIYGGISQERLGRSGLQWPCPDEDHPGTTYLHKGKFSRGLGKFNPVAAKNPAEQPDENYPLVLTTGRVLHHYHTGTMTRRSEPLDWVDPEGFAVINPEDAERVSVQDGEPIIIESRRGRVQIRTEVSGDVAPGTIFLAFHWREAPANRLTQDYALDPVAKIPEYKVTAVRLINPRLEGEQPEAVSGG
jgi:predicted molibdopterin-dependent oxidoreductase YjgC